MYQHIETKNKSPLEENYFFFFLNDFVVVVVVVLSLTISTLISLVLSLQILSKHFFLLFADLGLINYSSRTCETFYYAFATSCHHRRTKY
jgi:hypothetical protein